MPGFGHGTLRRRRRRWAHSPIAPSRLGAGSRGGGSFLPDVFGDARQWVEAAFGADLAADPDTWSWTDITPWVQWDPGVECKIGYPDESLAIVPASLACQIRNDQAGGGDFTLGNPLGRYWPNIRENTPIRARLDVGNGPTVRFQGYATSWTPFWDADRELAMVNLKAHGIARRLKQGKSAVKSALHRAYEYDSVQPVAYWTLEGGSGADTLYDEISNAPSGVVGLVGGAGNAGAAQFGQAFLAHGSDVAVSLFGYWILYLAVPSDEVTVTGQVTMQWHANFGTTVRTGTNAALRTGMLFDRGQPRYMLWQVITLDDGTITVKALEYSSGILVAGPTTLYSAVAIDDLFDGTPRAFQLDLAASGGTDVAWALRLNDETVSSGTYTPGFSGAMNAKPYLMETYSEAPSDSPTAFGHVAVYTTNVSPDRYTALAGHVGEVATTRLARICAEDGIAIEIAGDCDIEMGPQTPASFLDLVQECQTADGGILLDGLGSGFTYATRQAAYSNNPTLILDAGNGMITAPVRPVHDDQGRVNDYTAIDKYARKRRFTQPDGDLGTDTVGTYDDSGELSIDDIDVLYQTAAWKVAQGTVGGLRYPRLDFQLAKATTSTVAQQWLDTRPFGRVGVLSLEPGTAEPDRSFLLRGWNEKWNSKLWTVTANTTDYRVWSVLVLADDTGDDSPFIGWLDTDGSTISPGVAGGALNESTFETGTTESWTISGGSIGVTSSVSHSGSWSLTGTVSGSPSQSILRSPNVPVVPGLVYGASMWLQSPGGYANTRAAIDWYDSGGSYISTASGTISALPAGTWTLYTVSGTAPANAATAVYGPTLFSSPPNGTGYKVDDGLIGEALTVSTPSGPVWTNPAASTYTDDIDGLYVNLDGLKVAIVAISGTASPQTFVVDNTDLLRAVPPGASVTVWNPPVLGL